MKFRKLSPIQQKLAAHTLLLRRPSTDEDSIVDTLNTARIDLQPHQISAALFAFKNPLGKGAILSDEVGLGKTIEAGLIISQYWAMRKRKIMIIAPKALVNQWRRELEILFNLKAQVLETKDWKKILDTKMENPFSREEYIIVTTEFFVAKQDAYLKKKLLDLVVIDEAHKLRNVYNPAETAAKRAKSVKSAIVGAAKIVLLTATPIQNDLLDIFGLVSFIDDRLLGTFSSFRANYKDYTFQGIDDRLKELKHRISSVQTRELRRNCIYINYKDRHAIDEYFEAFDDEQELCEEIADFIQNKAAWCLPRINKKLIELMYHRLLGSSIPAVKNSILKMSRNALIAIAVSGDEDFFSFVLSHLKRSLSYTEYELIIKHTFRNCEEPTYSSLRKALIEKTVGYQDALDDEEMEPLQEEAEELLQDQEATINELDDSSKGDVMEEISQLLSMYARCGKISKQSKSEKLKFVLAQQFRVAEERGFPKKAVIFTEFRKTQDYILRVLGGAGFDIGEVDHSIVDERSGRTRKVVGIHKEIALYHGGSGDDQERAEVIRQFKENDEIKILISTESGAEGLNLQFCNLVVNFDLPWNPQRIEQRIGRCHRYGQKFETFVVNFINKKNKAEVKVYDILKNKFKLFEGVFGASDQVIASLTSDSNFELKILDMYRSAKDPGDLEKKYQAIVEENKDLIDAKMKVAFDDLLYHFDSTVVNKIDIEKIKDKFETKTLIKANLLRDFILSSMDPENVKYVYPAAYTITYEGFPKTPISFTRNAIFPFLSPNDDRVADFIKKAADRPVNSSSIEIELPTSPKINDLEHLRGCCGLLKVFRIEFNMLDARDFLYYQIVEDERIHDDQESLTQLLSTQFNDSENKIEIGSNSASQEFFERHLKKLFDLVEDENSEAWINESERIDGYKDDLLIELDVKLQSISKQQMELRKERRSSGISKDDRNKINRQLSRLEMEETNIAAQKAEIIRDCNEEKSKARKRIEKLAKISSDHNIILEIPVRIK